MCRRKSSATAPAGDTTEPAPQRWWPSVSADHVARQPGHQAGKTYNSTTASTISRKQGTAYFASVVIWLTDKGREISLACRDVRDACLMPGFTGSAEDNAQIGELARLLRTLSGRYDQAARAASTSSL